MEKLVLISISFVLLSCNQTKVDTKAEGEKIMQLSKEWSQAASQGDVDKTVSYWGEDAVLISAGHPVLNGKKEIKNMVEESFRIPGFRISWQPRSVVVSDGGDMAYMIEDSEISFADSTGRSIIQKNKAVSIWRKESDGSWKNVVDISTPEEPQNP